MKNQHKKLLQLELLIRHTSATVKLQNARKNIQNWRQFSSNSFEIYFIILSENLYNLSINFQTGRQTSSFDNYSTFIIMARCQLISKGLATYTPCHWSHILSVLSNYTGYLTSNNNITAILYRSYSIIDDRIVYFSIHYTSIQTTKPSTNIRQFLRNK